jgi:electron transport complex protein RnfG
MKEILKITVSLTGVCIAAALILGAVFTQTDPARKEIEKKEKEEIINSLLGFGHGKQAPQGFNISASYRYVITGEAGATTLGYVVPLKDGKHSLVQIDLEGKPVKAAPVSGTAAELTNQAARDAAVNTALGKGDKAVYSDTFYASDIGGKPHGYVLPGRTQGFKTFIKMMVSLDPNFTVTGLAITESEEDPGLGAEIQQDYFKSQFSGKTLDVLKTLDVQKKPLPDAYLDVLDPAKAKKAQLKPEQIAEVKKQHLKDDIYALTGATISSRAVTRGVKEIVRKFVYRFEILKKAAEQQKLQLAF